MFFRLSKLMRPHKAEVTSNRSGILVRLLRSKRAATLPVVAAAIFPMIGIIGGGVDMSRVYLVKSRLQQACDAGALAARRAMTGTTLTSAANTQGQNFFSANLRNGKWGSTGVSVTYTAATDGAVNGTANASVPMTLMKVFGQNTRALQVTCQAQLNVSNNDVLFVLDMTGSMGCVPADSETNCRTYAGSNLSTTTGIVTEKANSRADGLRAAVEDFAVILAGATSSTARLRIGFITYNSTVRIGNLGTTGDILASLTTPMKSSAIYRTRVANFTTSVWDPNVGAWSSWTNESGGNRTPANCRTFGDAADTTTGASPGTITDTQYQRYSWNGNTSTGSWGNGSSTAACIRQYRTRTTTHTQRYKFTNWTNDVSRSFDTADFMAGTETLMAFSPDPPSTARTTTSGSWTVQELADKQDAGTAWGLTVAPAAPWDGCIIERAADSDMTTAPTSEALRWAPAWPEVTRLGSSDTPRKGYWTPTNYACPKRSMQLTEVTSANLSVVRNYVNVLNGTQTVNSDTGTFDFLPSGKTYHDIGMVWATRIMHPSGMFSALHGAAPNGRPVTRSIIFMTDGDMDTGSDSYSAYGIESSGDAAHNTRFQAACSAARAQGINLYVISFAQALTSDLISCANDSTRDFQANNTAELQDALSTIAQRIAELRLTQ